MLDIIEADIEMPPGTLIHEQDPSHTIHRQLLSRVFTPRAVLAIEPAVRAFCAQRLDELVGRDSFDFVAEFAQFVPMRVFGMLLGIPEEIRSAREHVEASMDASRQGQLRRRSFDRQFYSEWVMPGSRIRTTTSSRAWSRASSTTSTACTGP
jgi:cytochrome P450